MLNLDKNITSAVVTNLLTLVIGASLGFGGSQLFIVFDVKRSQMEIAYLTKADEDMRREQKAIYDIIDEKMRVLNVLFQENLRLNVELVKTISIQNELLLREKR